MSDESDRLLSEAAEDYKQNQEYREATSNKAPGLGLDVNDERSGQ